MRRASRHPAWIALLLALATAAPAAAASAAPPALTARAAVLYNPQAHRVLFGKHADRHERIASLTKIMTALLALRHPMSVKITARADVLPLPQTKAGLVPGHTYTLGELLPVLIVRSANDAAVAIADGLAGSVPAFVAEMNRTAGRLGLKNTRYANPNGLDTPGEYSTARDVAVLSGVAMNEPAFRRLAGLRTAALPGGPTFDSLNPFLSVYPGADGVKTGFTSNAEFCLSASAVHGGRRLIAVVLGEPSFAAADRDAARLLDWGFAHPPKRTKPPAAAAATRPKPPPAAARAAQAARPATPAPPASAAAPPRSPTSPQAAAHRPDAASPLPVRPALLLACALAGALLGLRALHRARRAAARARRRTTVR